MRMNQLHRCIAVAIISFFVYLMLWWSAWKPESGDGNLGAGVLRKLERIPSCHGGERNVAGACILSESGRCLPTFLIAGAMKAGTGALMKWLNQHPYLQSGMNVARQTREVHFFDRPDFHSLHCPMQSYLESFPIGVLTFDKSPSYMAHPEAMQRAADMFPDIKVVVLLREPVSRAYSGFMHNCRHRRYARIFNTTSSPSPSYIVNMQDMSRSDERTLTAEMAAAKRALLQPDTHQVLGKGCTPADFREYMRSLGAFDNSTGASSVFNRRELQIGEYARQLEAILSAGIPTENILILFQEDMVQDTPETLRRVENFVFAGLFPSSAVPHHSYGPRRRNGLPYSTRRWGWDWWVEVIADVFSPLAYAGLPVRGSGAYHSSTMHDATESALRNYYRPHMRALAALLENKFQVKLPSVYGG